MLRYLDIDSNEHCRGFFASFTNRLVNWSSLNQLQQHVVECENCVA
ncbi:hypothetical protein PPIS_a1498 [Pseudoalteromonas piscicida]|uniref:Zf-HC2 domain-containing protein n=1 Tax=Pseudoalteromonas piscicida TaxID=43662 RepID=A0ABN5CH29_PSEO7|nr:hypothetical protein PPIS_a1498 [Pseudoalteromonas piscicida]